MGVSAFRPATQSPTREMRRRGLPNLVLLRHGQSEWNFSDRFSGWADVELTDQGRCEAAQAGRTLKHLGFRFDHIYTSVQKRAIGTAQLALENMDYMHVPLKKRWELNERHYGNLTGFNKEETAQRLGRERVMRWRRSFDAVPPPMVMGSRYCQSHSYVYNTMYPEALAVRAESLELTLQRITPLWEADILPQLRASQRVLVVAHANTIRSICWMLEQSLNHENIQSFKVPTGVPLAYHVTSSGEMLTPKDRDVATHLAKLPPLVVGRLLPLQGTMH